MDDCYDISFEESILKEIDRNFYHEYTQYRDQGGEPIQALDAALEQFDREVTEARAEAKTYLEQQIRRGHYR